MADSVSELAKKLGTSANTIYVRMSRDKAKGVEGRYVKVVIDDD
jgi:transposase-like protein